MKNKRGSHVGFIISFILFITFVIFLLGLVNPSAKVQTEKKIVLENLKENVIKEISANLTIISIKQKNPGICKIPNDLILENYATKESGEVIKIYSSQEIFDPQGNCNVDSAFDENDLGLIRNTKYIFKTKIEEMKKNYEEDYSSLKNRLNLPEENNFEFIFLEENGNEIKVESEEIRQTDVFSKLISISYIDKDGEIKTGYLNLKTW